MRNKYSQKIFLLVIMFVTSTFAGGQKQASPEINVTAREIMYDYDANPVAANSKYMKKLVQVTGVISEIDTKFFGGYKVKLAASDDLIGGNLICSFGRDKKGDIVALRKYQHVTLVGFFSGKIGNILLKDCRVVQ